MAVWLSALLALLLSVAVQAGAEGEDPLIRDDGRTRGALKAPITLITIERRHPLAAAGPLWRSRSQ